MKVRDRVAQRWADLYQHDHPAVKFRFEISGGGGTRGLQQLARGEADIVQTKTAAFAAGNSNTLVRIPVAVESVVVYVKVNVATELTLARASLQ